MPLDDFNSRIVIFGRDAQQARAIADALSKRPWHNVMYYSGAFGDLDARALTVHFIGGGGVEPAQIRTAPKSVRRRALVGLVWTDPDSILPGVYESSSPR